MCIWPLLFVVSQCLAGLGLPTIKVRFGSGVSRVTLSPPAPAWANLALRGSVAKLPETQDPPKKNLLFRLEVHPQLIPQLSTSLASLSHVSNPNNKHLFFQTSYTKAVEQKFSGGC